MIRWTLDRHMKAAGIANANQLALRAGITSPQAYRLLSGEPIERIDVKALARLCELFACQPGDLLEFVGEKRRK